MKLTWFGGTTIRIHIGGAILVVDAAGAPAGIDPVELVSGADTVVDNFGGDLAAVDGAQWKPRKPVRPLDVEEGAPLIEAVSLGLGALLIDAADEAPLLLLHGVLPKLGRWAESAIVVVFGDQAQMIGTAEALLEARPPRLLLLAGEEAAIDAAIPAVRDRLDGAGLMALEARMALEV